MGDNWFQLFQAAQSIIMLIAGLFVWLWGRNRKAEMDNIDGRFHVLEHQIERINDQLSSKLIPAVQALISRLDRQPDELRAKFYPLDRAEDMRDEWRRNIAVLWAEIEKLRSGHGGAQ